MKHEKWSLFEQYAKAIGIDQEPELESWKAHEKKWAAYEAKLAEEKRLAEEKKKAEEEAAKLAEQKAEAEAKAAEEAAQAKALEQMKTNHLQLILKMGLANGQSLKQVAKQPKAGAA